MNHLDVFFLVTDLHDRYGFTDQEIAKILYDHTDIPVSSADITSIRSTPPKTKLYVQALADRGFSPSYIQRKLGLSQPTVSYHLNTQANTIYRSTHLRNIIINLAHPDAIRNLSND